MDDEFEGFLETVTPLLRDRRLDELLPGQLAVLAMHLVEPLHRARHGDGAVAGALMQFAALNPVDEWLAEYMEVPRRDAQVDEMDTDTDLEYGGRMAGW